MLKGKNSWKYRGKTPVISHGPLAEPMPDVQPQKKVCVLKKKKKRVRARQFLTPVSA